MNNADQARTVYFDELREKRILKANAAHKTGGYRNKTPKLRTYDNPKDMVVHRSDGVIVTIPGSWFYKTSGKIKSKYLGRYMELISVAIGGFIIYKPKGKERK